jgi:tetratricopeptide (TPR) repeat protein
MATKKIKKKGKKGENLSASPRQIPNNHLKKDRPSISVCMIVKDEERFIANCLKSIKDIADEIIIIDTGSQDNTINIAKRYTDRIYFHPWKDNYSEARNHYFEYATGDWIFQVDADEELLREDIPALLKAVKYPDIDLIMVQIVSFLDKGKSQSSNNLGRLFRNNGVIHYEGRIHEKLVGYKKPVIFPVRLSHYGYDLDEDSSKNKFDKRISLLKMDIDDDPDNPIAYHYLSCCYISRNLFHETLNTSLKAIELSEKKNNKDPVFLWSRYNAALAYYNLQDYINAESMALSAIAENKYHLDSFFILTVIYLEQSKWSEALKCGSEYSFLLKKIRNQPDEFGTIVFNTLNESWLVMIWMAIASLKTGDSKDSETYIKSTLSQAPDRFNALKTIGQYCYRKGLSPEAHKYLKLAFDLNKEDPVVNDLLDRISSGGQITDFYASSAHYVAPVERAERTDTNNLAFHGMLSSYINQCLPDKAMELIQNNPQNLNITASELCRVADLYMEKGQVESAIKCYMMALERDTGLFEAWTTLAEITLNLNRLDEAQMFFAKALEIRQDDEETILGLCEIGALKGELDIIVKYCDVLLKKLNMPSNKTITCIDDLRSIFLEIENQLEKKTCSERINNIISHLSHRLNNNTPTTKINNKNGEPSLTIAFVDIPQNFETGDYYYRTYSPGMELARGRNIYVVSVSNIHPNKVDVINNADVVILNNICDPDLLPIISKRRDKGLRTVFELADDLNALQPWNAVYEFYNNKENIGLIYKLANYCDKLQFSVFELQRLYGMLNTNNEVFQNQILELHQTQRRNYNDDFIIGWGGSHGHLEDVASISEPLIKWVLSRPNIKLHLMCSRAIWELFKDLPENRKRYFPTGSIKDYYEFLNGVHVGIAPLRNTAFNRARSDVKYLEYAVSGVVPIVSDLETYQHVIDGENGFVFKNELDLIKRLDLLENNRQLLEKFSLSAKAYVTRHRLQSDHVTERIEFYMGSLSSGLPRNRKNSDPEKLFESWCNIPGSSRNANFLTLYNTEFEKSVYSGLVLMQNEANKPSANECFKKASELEPKNYLPFLYSSQTSNTPIDQLENAIKLAPFSIKAHLLLGEELARQGKIIDALNAFTQAYEISPLYHLPLVRAGNLLKTIGRHNEAEELFRCASNLQIKINNPNPVKSDPNLMTV